MCSSTGVIAVGWLCAKGACPKRGSGFESGLAPIRPELGDEWLRDPVSQRDRDDPHLINAAPPERSVAVFVCDQARGPRHSGGWRVLMVRLRATNSAVETVRGSVVLWDEVGQSQIEDLVGDVRVDV
ncbi:hypothetical protein GCM10017786_21190 [Amycolatopsis deserti]|uniref:Uncharacterized protein n=1 Tax=Amycolatopsis deserti TaxID=185696 RepID=A0ABQ3IMQ0_9PSEU|nr:hypothetical protein GCM10017786_21190 [Amycolatopsis deserti]